MLLMLMIHGKTIPWIRKLEFDFDYQVPLSLSYNYSHQICSDKLSNSAHSHYTLTVITISLNKSE